MPTRAEVRLLQFGQKRVSEMARRELAGWWAMLDKTDLDRLRSEVETFFPILIEEYGRVAEVAAADWYEDIYKERSRLSARGLSNEQMARARARWAIGESWRGNHAQALSTLQLVGAEMVRQFGRDAIVQSAKANKRMFARIPAGSETCSWCLMLASRGFAYHSADDAKPMTTSHYGTCDCEVVADDGRTPDGYDPDALYDQYKSVQQKGDTDKDVARKLRAKYNIK